MQSSSWLPWGQGRDVCFFPPAILLYILEVKSNISSIAPLPSEYYCPFSARKPGTTHTHIQIHTTTITKGLLGFIAYQDYR